MADLQLEPRTAAWPEGATADGGPRPRAEPDWLKASNAEVARLASLTPEERRQEWEALTPEERAAEDAAFDAVLQSLADRRTRTNIYNPPID